MILLETIKHIEMKTKTQMRCDQLSEAGMAYDFNMGCYMGKYIYNRDFNVSDVEITCDSDEQWADKIERMTNEFNVRRKLAHD